MPSIDRGSHHKKFSIVLITAAIVAAVSGACSSTESAADVDQLASVDTKTVTIPVDGLICVACAARVKQTLQGIEGVTDVTVDLAQRNVRVQYLERKASVDAMVTAINGLGYKAGKPAPADRAKAF